MEELKPCPFCGSNDIRIVNQGYCISHDMFEPVEIAFRAQCHGCSCMILAPDNKSIIKYWNKRV